MHKCLLLMPLLMSLMFASPVFAAEEMTEADKETFQRLVFAEAGIETEDEQVATAAVILNRIESSEFPDSIEGVAYDSGAFSSVHDGSIWTGKYLDIEVTMEMIPPSTICAVERALAGEDPTEEALLMEAKALGLDEKEYALEGALYFYNSKACTQKALNARAKIKAKVKIGRQYFYKVWNQ